MPTGDRRGVRSSSRRNTPTPQPPSRGTTPTAARTSTRNATRATRSQSREVDSSAAASVPAAKNIRRGTRQASTESVDSVDSRAGRSIRGQNKRNTRAAPIGDLTTVEEDEDPEQAADPMPEQEASGTPPPDSADQPLPHRSPGGLSNISGTTAYSSASMAEAQDLEAGLMLGDLEDLYRISESFLNIMAPKDARSRDFERIIKDMRIPGSVTSKMFSKRSKVFDEYVEPFHSNFDYILPRAVAQTLFGSQQDLDSISGRPDAVLYKANLAVFARRILTDRGAGALWKDVQQLDLSFPERFLSGFSNALNSKGDVSTLREQTFKLALEIRTQVAIIDLSQELENGDDVDPDQILRTIFFKGSFQDPNEPDDEDIPFVRGWNVEGLGAGLAEIPQPFKDAVLRRMNDIRAFFDQDTLEVNTEALLTKYSWEGFCIRVLRWVRDRNQEIEDSIVNIGGIAALKNQVERTVKSLNPSAAPEDDEAARGPNVSNISAQSRKSRRPSYDPKKAVHFSPWEFLGPPRTGRPNSGDSVPVKTTTTRPVEGMEVNQDEDEWQPAPLEDDEIRGPQEESSTSRFPPSTNNRVARLAQEERTQKENQKQRFIDPQREAERVAWTDDLGDTQASRPSSTKTKGKGKAPVHASITSPGRASSVPARPQKRTHEAIEEETSDEEDFQQDTRPSDTKRRKAGPTSSRPRFEEPMEVPPSHQPQRRFPENRSRSVPAPAVPPESDYEDENDDDVALPTSSYRMVQQQAKRMAPPFQQRQGNRRARNPWTAQAEERLVRYIEEYGCQWAYIKRLDEASTQMFLDRTDVDLKDKARNMKVNYLRSGTGLPENFDFITLNKSVLARYNLLE